MTDSDDRQRPAPGRRIRARARRGWGALLDRFNRLNLSENAILLGFAVAIGCAAALGVVAFYWLIDLAYHVLFELPDRFLRNIDLLAWRPVITALGLLLAWWIMHRIGHGKEGQNVPDVQLAVARRGGAIETRPALARTAASAVTLGGGGSAGSEGPVAVLGATVGSFVGQLFRFSPDRVRIMVAAGAAAGISAAFNAPLAGAFFALEEILGSLAIGAFPPVVVASVMAAVVSQAFYGNSPAITLPTEYGFESVVEIFAFYPLLGVLAGFVGVLFVRTYFGAAPIIERLRVPPYVKPMIGGLLVGTIVFLSGGILASSGHLAFSLEQFARMEWYLLLLLVIGKILATSITLNSGGSGGVFTPALFVGAATGGAMGVALSEIFPALGLYPEAYALVGMGALVAAATHAPLTGILLVFEITNDYAIMMPLMLTTVIAYVVAKHIEQDSLYSGWLRRRGERIEQGRDEQVLASLKVRDVLHKNPQVIGETAVVTELLGHLGAGTQMEFPVVDASLRLRGMITVADLARIAQDRNDLSPVLIASDVAGPAATVTLDDTMLEAVRQMGQRGAASVPVVDEDNERLLGVVRHADVMAVYERLLARD
ncbi:MAG: chloride channel protein [Longimicrobiales bacterium]